MKTPSLRLMAVALGLTFAIPSLSNAAEVTDQGQQSARENDRREGTSKSTKKQPKRRRPTREVVKGFFVKINLGPNIWLPPISTWTNTTGTAMDFSVGYDIIDKLNFTLSVEGSFNQLLTNGIGVSDSSHTDIGPPSPIQGDFRVLAGTAALRIGPNFGGRKIKRANLSFIIGGGVGNSPQMVETWADNGYDGILQGRVLGLVTPGVGIEYYTKLSHFSLGLDVDYNLIIGGPVIAMGVAADFFVKYTF